MSQSKADLELAVAHLGLRSRLIELVVHGDAAWAVLISGELVPVDVGAGLDESGNVIVSFLLRRAPDDSDAYHIHADGVFVQTIEGKITKGRPCRLRMTFPVESSLVPSDT